MRWLPIDEAPLAPRAAASVSGGGGRLVVWGGSGQPPISYVDGAAYDVASGAWSKLPPAPLAARRCAGFAAGDEGCFVWGGLSASDFVTFDDGAFYRKELDEWRLVSRSPLSPRQAPFVAWVAERVLVFGGADAVGRRSFGDGAVYEPDSDRWEPLSACPVGAGADGRVWTGETLYVFTGMAAGDGDFARVGPTAHEAVRGGHTPGTAEERIASYDPHGDVWRELPPPPPEVAGRAALRLEDRFVVLRPDGDVLLWEPEGGVVSSATPLPGGRHTFSQIQGIFRLGETIVLFSRAGGGELVGWSFDLESGGWRGLPPIPLTPRHGVRAVAVGAAVALWGGLSNVERSNGPTFHRDGALLAGLPYGK